MQTSRQIVLVLLLSVVVSIIRIWFSQHPQFFPILEDTSLLDQPAPPSVFYSNFTLKTKLAIDNVADHPDLYIWFKDPNEMAKMSNIRVTRCQHIEEPYDKLHERLLVEPLLCSDDKKTLHSCPDSNILLSQGVDQEGFYRRNQHSKLFFWRILSSPKIKAQSIHSVTVWSVNDQQHIPLPYNRTTINSHLTCNSPEKCPTFCPRRNRHKPSKWDERDFLCKSTDPSAIPPHRRYGGQCTCEATCFTKETGQVNSTWPWKSQSQRDQFYKPHLSKKAIARQRLRLKDGKELRKSKSFHYTTRFDNAHCNRPESSSNIDLSLDIFSDFQHHFYFLPDAKLLFCGIPKVGISEFIKFFRFAYGAKDYLSLVHYKADREEFQLKNVGLEKAQELLKDPTWTKAVFFRDPAERLLSAYLNKVKGQGYTQKWFHIGQAPYIMSFSDFVDLISVPDTSCSDPRGLHACTDPHWKPQIMTCGLDYLLPYMDFVGDFDHVANHTKQLFSRVGMWEEFGAKFDDARDQPQPEWGSYETCYMRPPPRPANYSYIGFNQRGGSSTAHSTASQRKFDEYYTPEILEKVKQAYALDYEVLDDLKRRPPGAVASGRDLKIVKESCPSPEEQN